MFNRNHVCAIAAMAAISMISLTACSDENVTSPSGESGLSSGESGDTVQLGIQSMVTTATINVKKVPGMKRVQSMLSALNPM